MINLRTSKRIGAFGVLAFLACQFILYPRFWLYCLSYNKLLLDVLLGRAAYPVARYETNADFSVPSTLAPSMAARLAERALQAGDFRQALRYGSVAAKSDFQAGRRLLFEIQRAMAAADQRKYLWDLITFGTTSDPADGAFPERIIATEDAVTLATFLSNIALQKKNCQDQMIVSELDVLEAKIGLAERLKYYNWLSRRAGPVQRWLGLAEFGNREPEFLQRHTQYDGDREAILTGIRGHGLFDRAFTIKFPDAWPEQYPGILEFDVSVEYRKLEPSEVQVTDDWESTPIEMLGVVPMSGKVRVKAKVKKRTAQPRVMVRLTMRAGEKFQAERFSFRLAKD